VTDLRGLALYFDCFSGIAGDMTLGALLDLGVPLEAVRAELAKLPLADVTLTCERVRRGALTGTQVHVLEGGLPADRAREDPHDHDQAHSHDHDHGHAHPHDHGHAHSHDHDHPHDSAPPPAHHTHRHYREIRAMLVGALAGDVLGRALAIFDRIAAVEARLHGVPVEEVAFHEVGAVDSIVDIVGAAAALAWLGPVEITSRAVQLGGGTVMTAHGLLPVPAPATLELLAGAAVEAGGDTELTTPTGAAILAASATGYGPLPPMEVVAVGWGAGSRELTSRPNLLRVVAGRRAQPSLAGELVVLEANVDDMNPELCEPLLEALFAAGALDAWLQPIVMKKGRPALLIGALCEPARSSAVESALFAESTTLGVRRHAVSRTALARRMIEVRTRFGMVPIKVAGAAPEIANAAPEYEACRTLARAHGVPVKLVYQAALAELFRR
jgi:hypothetical protein